MIQLKYESTKIICFFLILRWKNSNASKSLLLFMDLDVDWIDIMGGNAKVQVKWLTILKTERLTIKKACI